MSPTLIIAEAGVNHNGSLDLALELIEAAARAGSDIVKFQSFTAAKLVRKDAAKAAYQVANTGNAETQFAMLRRLELSDSAHRSIADHCAANGIEFLSSPFDGESLRFLLDHCDLKRVKLGSGEITNGPLLLDVARSGKPLILSTGMATLGDIEQALAVLCFGYTTTQGAPSRDLLLEALGDAAARHVLAEKVTLLHCTTEYPAPLGEVNLRAMDALRDAFGLSTGYSDHTDGFEISVAAAARGASVIEKHFTLDKTLPGPDHVASLEPSELTAMVRQIRNVELALGERAKAPTPTERRNLPIARKSIVAARDIAAGTVLSADDLDVKRPGNGLSPMLIWDLVGSSVGRDYKADEPIER